MNQPILALTMGDPGGIGPEIIAKSWKSRERPRDVFCVLYGTAGVFRDIQKKLKFSLPLNPVSRPYVKELKPGSLNFIDVTDRQKVLLQTAHPRQTLGQGYDPGRVSLRNAAGALAALEAAARDAVQKKIDGIVTAPIHKTAMRLVDPHFKGHTEYLARAAKAKHFAMMFVGDRLKVTLATIHVPIKEVSRRITQALVFEKIQLTHEFLKRSLGLKNPLIAVCALNPHGKETGTEDEAEIRPAVKRAVKKGISAVGPLSADQLFYDAYEGRFDAVVSMYHDQALAPFKMIAFRDGVNVTLGLPFVRTSPDHGTAMDIAYQGKADPVSFLSALKRAAQWSQRSSPRHAYTS